jgi:hypothetical protein
MRENLYLFVMLAIILVMVLVTVPSLFRAKCPRCGARNRLDAKQCAKCGEALPDD